MSNSCSFRDHHATISRHPPNQLPITMAKVEFEHPIKSVTGILVRTDPYYLRRYPKTGGGVQHIAQARPDRSKHVATPAEADNRQRFALQFGKQKHNDFIERTMKGQTEIEFNDANDANDEIMKL